jgi:protein SCO1/2
MKKTKNNTYIWISFIILIFGIYVIPRIIERISKGKVVTYERLDNIKKE